MRGWVLGVDLEDAEPGDLKPIAKITGHGPPEEIVDLSEWAAWRWAGPRQAFLRSASPDRVVRELPAPIPGGRTKEARAAPSGEFAHLFASDAGEARAGVVVLRLPPAEPQLPVVLDAAAVGDALVLLPTTAAAERCADALRRRGVVVSLMPGDWKQAAAGGVVVGTRSAAWAPVRNLAAVVVIDEHDESYKEERAPCWHARDVVVERARRRGVPCVLVSPAPSLEALRIGRLETLDRGRERAGWPLVEVVDRTRDDQPGLYSSRLVTVLREAERSVVILNRKGRSVLLACCGCDALARCDTCQGSLRQADGVASSVLTCRRCGSSRPLVCDWCGAVRFKNLRVGVTRVREELEALLRRPVAEVTEATGSGPAADAACTVGTEALLRRSAQVDVVAFLEFDQELLAGRYRASEEAFALIVQAARIAGGRDRGGRVLIQTRLAACEVVAAAVAANPGLLAAREQRVRADARWPPTVAMAAISGAQAEAYVESVRQELSIDDRDAGRGAADVLGPADGTWLVRASDHRSLCDLLGSIERPPGRVRVDVDPLRP